jgi:hypothetical protein
MPRPPGTRQGWPLSAVLILAVTLRLLFLVAVDHRAISIDLKGWIRVAEELERGHNPYSTTSLLNWQPLWVVVVWGLGKISSIFGFAFVRTMQVLLIASEAGLIIATDRLMATLNVPNRRLLLLAGFAVNPIFILLTCQHGNFDVIPATAIVLFLLWLCRWLGSGKPRDWFIAACFLGIGILAKTVPAILSPLALAGSSRLRFRQLVLGAALALGPAAIATLGLLALDPAATMRNVVAYRSVPVGFGWSSVLRAAGGAAAVHNYGRALPFIIGPLLIGIAIRIRRTLTPAPFDLVLASFLLLIGIPIFGSGYGPQYLFWYWPLLLCVAPLASRTFRIAAGLFAVVATVTYVLEYALVDYLGKFLLWRGPGAFLSRVATSVTGHLTIANGPLFLSYVALFAAGMLEMTRRTNRLQAPEP